MSIYFLRFPGWCVAGMERVKDNTTGQFQAQKDWLPCVACAKFSTCKERWGTSHQLGLRWITFLFIFNLSGLNTPPIFPCCPALASISPTKNHHTSSTSEAVPPPTLSQNRAFSLPPGHAVCCFMDGGVGLYDMGAKKWDFLRDLVRNTNNVPLVGWEP